MATLRRVALERLGGGGERLLGAPRVGAEDDQRALADPAREVVVADHGHRAAERARGRRRARGRPAIAEPPMPQTRDVGDLLGRVDQLDGLGGGARLVEGGDRVADAADQAEAVARRGASGPSSPNTRRQATRRGSARRSAGGDRAGASTGRRRRCWRRRPRPPPAERAPAPTRDALAEDGVDQRGALADAASARRPRCPARSPPGATTAPAPRLESASTDGAAESTRAPGAEVGARRWATR